MTDFNIDTLNNLPCFIQGKIFAINCTGTIRRRLLDLGFVPGSFITPILTSPSGDPRAFEIRGTLIAIRKEDAKLISITF